MPEGKFHHRVVALAFGITPRKPTKLSATVQTEKIGPPQIRMNLGPITGVIGGNKRGAAQTSEGSSFPAETSLD